MISPDETANFSSDAEAANPFTDHALPGWLSNGGPPLPECGLVPDLRPPLICVLLPVLGPEAPLDEPSDLDPTATSPAGSDPLTGPSDATTEDSALGLLVPPTDPSDFGFCATLAPGEETGDLLIGSCWPVCSLPLPIDGPPPAAGALSEDGEVGDKPDPEGWTDPEIPSADLTDAPLDPDTSSLVYLDTDHTFPDTEDQIVSDDYSLYQFEDSQYYACVLYTFNLTSWYEVDTSFYYSSSDNWVEPADATELADDEIGTTNLVQLIDNDCSEYNYVSNLWPEDITSTYQDYSPYQDYSTNTIDSGYYNSDVPSYRGLASSDEIQPWYRSVLQTCSLNTLEEEDQTELVLTQITTRTLDEALTSELKGSNVQDTLSLTIPGSASNIESLPIEDRNVSSINSEMPVIPIITQVNSLPQPADITMGWVSSPAPADALTQDKQAYPPSHSSSVVPATPPLDPAVWLLLEDSGVTPRALDQFDLPLVASNE